MLLQLFSAILNNFLWGEKLAILFEKHCFDHFFCANVSKILTSSPERGAGVDRPVEEAADHHPLRLLRARLHRRRVVPKVNKSGRTKSYLLLGSIG
jgi:hypothetical protein